MKNKPKSVFEGIKTGLQEAVEHSAGKTKAKSVTLVIAPISDYGSKDVKRIRSSLSLSQVAFAKLMGVHRRTIESWESGEHKPNGPAQRFLEIIEKDREAISRTKIMQG